MSNPKFTKSGYSDLEFGRGVLYPARRPQTRVQVIERTAGGELQVEDLGVTIHARPIRVRGFTKAIFDGLRVWHLTAANGAVNTFTYVDEDDTSNIVRWLDDTLDAIQYFNGRYEAEILLEIVS